MTARVRLDYVILYVEDVERSVAFYRDVIGVPHKLTGDGYAEFATENVKLGLFAREKLSDLTGDASRPGGPTAEILFLIDDVDAEAERLRAAGVRVLTGPVDRPWGHRTIHVADPDGTIIEFAHEIPRAG